MLKKIISFFALTAIIVLNCSYIAISEGGSENYIPDKEYNKVNTIVIDAGHGGKDIGCHGAFSYEKNVALEIALKLGKDIKKNYPDVNVIYTRKTDVFVTLEGRADIANKAHADLFICVHCNAGPPSAYGTETWVMGLYKSQANLKVAMRENSSILMEDDYKTRYKDFDPNSPESYIAMSLRQSAYIKQSLMFANDIETQLRDKGRNDRGVKQAGFWVLYRTTMPSVLIETGFLTNPEEEKYMNSDSGQNNIASSICKAFGEYKTAIESRGNAVTNNTKKDTTSIVATKPEVKKIKADSKNKKHKKDKKATIINSNVPVFKVQIVTSSKNIETTPENFNGLKDITMYKTGDLYRYTYGNYNNFGEASDMQDTLRNKGYKDAFVVSFLNGKRIAISEAIKMLK